MKFALALLAATATLIAAPKPSLTPVADMSITRSAHTTTTLRDGRVLVLGGFTGESNANRSAEWYDARSGRFHALPRMITPRHSHSATLLSDGTVLIAGGYESDGAVIARSEIFDPGTNSFRSIAPMRHPRAGHIAVLLDDGRVLLAGGVGPAWTFLSNAEIYDPATGTFTNTGAMTVARESHVAARLHDGRVLVVGGHRDRRSDIKLYASAEVFDAKSGTFTPTGSMHTRRHKHDAVLLQDGRVLVSGGSDERDDRGAYTSTEIYNATTNSFSPGPEMQLARYKHQGTSTLLPNGDVVLAGGAGQAELLSVRDNRFSVVSGETRMAGQFAAAALLPGGHVLITGGYGGGTGPRASAWVLHP
ncbi:MAG: Kelch repeat-containing protein [Gemmatimonas sp.]